MEVILVEDIKGVGKLGDEVSVKTGYARNFLFPNKLAIIATESNSRLFKDLSRKEVKKRAEQKSHFETVAKEYNGKSVSVSAQTHQGKLYGSFTPNDFIKLVKQDLGLDIKKRQLAMPDHIKEVGKYSIDILLHPEVSAKLELIISSTSAVEETASLEETEEGENNRLEKESEKAKQKARLAAAEKKMKKERAEAESNESDASESESEDAA